MNSAHIHLILNHVPIIGIILGSLFLVLFFVKREVSYIMIGLMIFIITGLITIPTFTSGEGAEEILERLVGVEEIRIEKHEELGEKALIFIEVISAFSLIYLIVIKLKKKISNAMVFIILLLSIGCIALLLFVNNSGVEIRHGEIRKITKLSQ